MEKKNPDTIGYDGYFPRNSVLEFHNESFGIVNGEAAIHVYIENGEYKGYSVSVKKEGVRHE